MQDLSRKLLLLHWQIPLRRQAGRPGMSSVLRLTQCVDIERLSVCLGWISFARIVADRKSTSTASCRIKTCPINDCFSVPLHISSLVSKQVPTSTSLLTDVPTKRLRPQDVGSQQQKSSCTLLLGFRSLIVVIDKQAAIPPCNPQAHCQLTIWFVFPSWGVLPTVQATALRHQGIRDRSDGVFDG